jgi:hypothetical protein
VKAGTKYPGKELSIAEVHDCFNIHDMLIYEDLNGAHRVKQRLI